MNTSVARRARDVPEPADKRSQFSRPQPAVGAYTDKYGCTAQGRDTEEDWPADDRPEDISAEEFEEHWRAARQAIENR